MLISSTEELRLYSPANAIDHIETLMGFLDSSEQDFLLEKLGQPLYDALSEYYRGLRDSNDGISTFIQKITDGEPLPPYARLLSLAQRIITFDALGRAVDMQAISVNGSGINISTADDYQKADDKAVQNYKATCVKEAHAAVNRLLVTLEEWTKEVPNIDTTAFDADSDEATNAEEKKEIVEKWRTSRFFYLAAGLVIPSATVLQEYLNIYDSREKFIQLLPGLRYIQEDIIAPIIGEDFMDFLIEQSQTVKEDDKKMLRILHKLRKAVARHLEARVMQKKSTDDRHVLAHDEAVRLTTDLTEYLQQHQPDFADALAEAFQKSPLYVAPETTEETTSDYVPQFENNAEGSVMFVTPALP